MIILYPNYVIFTIVNIAQIVTQKHFQKDMSVKWYQQLLLTYFHCNLATHQNSCNKKKN